MSFRVGRFQRDDVHRVVRHFCPLAAYHTLAEIPLEELHEQGKKLILLDVDNTLVRWKQEDFEDHVLAWLDRARELGFNMCILSNTRHPERLTRISNRLKIPFIRSRFKPSRRMYLMALKKFSAKPEEAVMIGDQILTDILGSNRAGIEAIWLNRISHHEFIGTRLANRVLERALVPILYKALPAISKLPDPIGAPEETSVRTQLLKFIAVGGSSFVVDTGVFLILYNGIHVGGEKLGIVTGAALLRNYPGLFAWAGNAQKASTPLFKTFGAAAGICNSFYWNRRWTFGITDTDSRARQFTRFAIINGTGALMNVGITSMLVNVFPAGSTLFAFLASAIAAGLVMIWNFTGTRLWAFRKS
jgi:putative phosphatase